MLAVALCTHPHYGRALLDAAAGRETSIHKDRIVSRSYIRTFAHSAQCHEKLSGRWRRRGR